MDYKDRVTPGDLKRALRPIPAGTIIDMACGPETNMAEPLAMAPTGELDVLRYKLRSNGTPALVLWSMHMECLEER